MNKIIS